MGTSAYRYSDWVPSVRTQKVIFCEYDVIPICLQVSSSRKEDIREVSFLLIGVQESCPVSIV